MLLICDEVLRRTWLLWVVTAGTARYQRSKAVRRGLSCENRDLYKKNRKLWYKCGYINENEDNKKINELQEMKTGRVSKWWAGKSARETLHKSGRAEETWSACFFTSLCTAHWDVGKEESSCASVEPAQANVLSSPVPDTALCACTYGQALRREHFLSYCTEHASPTALGNALEIYFEKYFLFCV